MISFATIIKQPSSNALNHMEEPFTNGVYTIRQPFLHVALNQKPLPALFFILFFFLLSEGFPFVPFLTFEAREFHVPMEGDGNANANAKRLKVTHGQPHVPRKDPILFPVSPYRLFMESFMVGCTAENYMEYDRAGYEKWKTMTNEEKHRYVTYANALDFNHQQLLDMEAQLIVKVQDEAESPLKIDKEPVV